MPASSSAKHIASATISHQPSSTISSPLSACCYNQSATHSQPTSRASSAVLTYSLSTRQAAKSGTGNGASLATTMPWGCSVVYTCSLPSKRTSRRSTASGSGLVLVLSPGLTSPVACYAWGWGREQGYHEHATDRLGSGCGTGYGPAHNGGLAVWQSDSQGLVSSVGGQQHGKDVGRAGLALLVMPTKILLSGRDQG